MPPPLLRKMTYQTLLSLLQLLEPKQLEMEVIALIDAEPWPCNKYQVAPKDDPEYPNRPYLVFE